VPLVKAHCVLVRLRQPSALTIHLRLKAVLLGGKQKKMLPAYSYCEEETNETADQETETTASASLKPCPLSKVVSGEVR
jgi:hypothetical protein